MIEQRYNVVSIAREWIRTPFVWGGRIKGQAADCTFVAKVYEEAGIVEPVAIPDYFPQAAINGFGGGLYESILARVSKGIVEAPLPGDLALFEMARGRTHSGVIIDWPLLIHADAIARFVVYGDGTQMPVRGWRFYTFW